ncbi:MAG: hypothetical protein WDO70_01350 [Alphaproteobacteria bacterium]
MTLMSETRPITQDLRSAAGEVGPRKGFLSRNLHVIGTALAVTLMATGYVTREYIHRTLEMTRLPLAEKIARAERGEAALQCADGPENKPGEIFNLPAAGPQRDAVLSGLSQGQCIVRPLWRQVLTLQR